MELSVRELLLRVVVVVSLAVHVYIHFKLAPDMDFGDAAITKGALFRAHAIAAIVVAVLVLVWPRRWTYGLAFLVAASALGAMLLYRYIDVGQLGPVANMHEPIWYTDKVVAAVSEAVAAVAALLGVLVVHARERTRGRSEQVGG